MSERGERSYDLKTFEPTKEIFKEREKDGECDVFERKKGLGMKEVIGVV